jgi:hypothetical protein
MNVDTLVLLKLSRTHRESDQKTLQIVLYHILLLDFFLNLFNHPYSPFQKLQAMLK